MKATGIIRRIDDLGRIVIPKEIRKTMHIRESNPLEIFTEKDGSIILKKYSPIGEMGSNAQQCAESIASQLPHTVCICDQDSVIAAAGPNAKKHLENYYMKNQKKHCRNVKIYLCIVKAKTFSLLYQSFLKFSNMYV